MQSQTEWLKSNLATGYHWRQFCSPRKVATRWCSLCYTEIKLVSILVKVIKQHFGMNDTHERTRHVRYERERKDPPSKIFPRGNVTSTYTQRWYPKLSCFATNTWYCRSIRYHRRISFLVPAFWGACDVWTPPLFTARGGKTEEGVLVVERNLGWGQKKRRGKRRANFWLDLTEIITFVMHLDIKYTDKATR